MGIKEMEINRILLAGILNKREKGANKITVKRCVACKFKTNTENLMRNHLIGHNVVVYLLRNFIIKIQGLR